MKLPEQWKPSKFVLTPRGLRASRDPAEVIRSSRFIADRLAELYQTLLETYASGHLLDLGCGKLPLYGVYRDLVQNVTAIDWANSMHPNPHLDVEHDLNQGIPFEDGAFDTVLATDLLEHIERPDRLFAHMSRVLAPGGALILTVPFLYGLHEIPHDYHRYTEYKLRSLCGDHGLDVVELDPYGGALEVLSDVTARLVGRRRWMAAVHLVLANAICNSPPGRKARRATERKFPLGYSLVARKPAAPHAPSMKDGSAPTDV